MRQTTPENMHLLHRTLFNLDAGKLPILFGHFGLDSTFLSAFLDAILFVQNDPNWLSRSISLLDSLRRCGRFKIALTFTPEEKVRGVFDELESHASSLEMKERVEQVKRIWI